MVTMAERMTRVETKLDNVESNLSSIDQKLTKFIDCSGDRFASKLTEKIVYGLVGTMISIIVTAVVTKTLNLW